MKAITRSELVALCAARRLAEALAKANNTDCSQILLSVALQQAEEEIGRAIERPPVAMCSIKIILNGAPWPARSKQ